MKSKISLYVFLLVVTFPFSLNAQSAAGGWQTHSFDDVGFSVAMPSKPELTPGKYITALGHQTAVRDDLYMARTRGGQVLYMAGLFAACPIEGNSPQEGIRELYQSEVRDGRVIGEVRNVSLGPIPGIEFLRQEADGWITLTRSYVAGTRVYSLAINANSIDTARSISAADKTRFFESFRILPARMYELLDGNRRIKMSFPNGIGRVENNSPRSLRAAEDCFCVSVFSEIVDAASFEQAQQKAVANFPQTGNYFFGPPSKGTHRGLPFYDLVGTGKSDRANHYEIRLLRLSQDKFLLVGGFYADVFNRLTPLTPYYKARLSNLFAQVLGSIEP